MTGHPADPRTGGAERLRGFDDYDVSLGDMLRGERATIGKSLLDVQRELKIKATYIDAIENADPGVFETPGFVAGYVRSYARYLGMDPEEIYARFCAESGFKSGGTGGAAPAQPTRSGRTVSEPVRNRAHDPFANPSVSFVPKAGRGFSVEPGALGSVAVLIALVAGLGYGGWTVLQEVQKVQFAPVDQAPGVASEVAELDGTVVAGAPAPAGQGVAAPMPTLEAYDRLYRPQALDVPVLTARDGPIATLDPERIGTLVPGPGESVANAREEADQPYPLDPGFQTALAALEGDADAAPGVQVTEPAAPEVVLFAVRPAWVRVRGADGSILLEKILDVGEEFTVPLTEEPATLRAGNSGSVYFSVNGTTYGPAGNGAAVVKGVALAPSPLTETYAVADPEDDRDLARYAEARAAAGEAPAE